MKLKSYARYLVNLFKHLYHFNFFVSFLFEGRKLTIQRFLLLKCGIIKFLFETKLKSRFTEFHRNGHSEVSGLCCLLLRFDECYQNTLLLNIDGDEQTACFSSGTFLCKLQLYLFASAGLLNTKKYFYCVNLDESYFEAHDQMKTSKNTLLHSFM